MKIYTWTDGRKYAYLPNPFEKTSPMTESWWLNHGGTIEEVEDPTPKPVYSYDKYKLKKACEDMNLWAELKSYIEQAGKWDSFILIQDLSSENPELQEIMPDLITAFGVETVNAVLEAAKI